MLFRSQISWREGLPHGDEGGGMVHNKGEVHGHGPWQERRHQSWKSHRPTRTVGRRCRSFGVGRGDVALVSSIRRSPYHQSGKSWTSFAWRCFVDCFIHGNGNDNACVIPLWRVWDSAEGAEPMCALSQGQSWLGEEKTLARPEASPSPWRDPLSRESLSRPRQAWEPLQAWRAWSLVKFF